jgi:hypothetical protein
MSPTTKWTKTGLGYINEDGRYVARVAKRRSPAMRARTTRYEWKVVATSRTYSTLREAQVAAEAVSA